MHLHEMHTALIVLVWWLSWQENNAEFMPSCGPTAPSWILIQIPEDHGNSLKLWTIIADLQRSEYCNPKCPPVGNLVDLQYWDQMNHPCDTAFGPFRWVWGQNTTVITNLALKWLCSVHFTMAESMHSQLGSSNSLLANKADNSKQSSSLSN